MKRLIVQLVLALTLVGSCFAGDWLKSYDGKTTVYGSYLFTTNITISPSNAVAVSITNYLGVGGPVYHTLQFFYSSTGTNATSTNYANAVIARSADGTNYVTYSTNSFGPETTTSTASGNGETAFTGKWQMFRIISTLAVTNASYTINYMGQ